MLFLPKCHQSQENICKNSIFSVSFMDRIRLRSTSFVAFFYGRKIKLDAQTISLSPQPSLQVSAVTIYANFGVQNHSHLTGQVASCLADKEAKKLPSICPSVRPILVPYTMRYNILEFWARS